MLRAFWAYNTKAMIFRSSFSRSSSPGFSLMETLVALTLLAFVLLWTMVLMVEEPQIQRRLDAHAEVLEVLEAVHEGIRAGDAVGPGETMVNWASMDDPPRSLVAARDLKVWSKVEAVSPKGLFHLTLKARYFVGLQPFERSLETLAWWG
jgi:prepilin-type N-terminal cleavage/methylation domain-containing protein